MKDKFKLFCFGFGQVAKYFVKNLIKKNFDVELITTNTTKTQMQKLDNLEYKSYYFSTDKFDKDLFNELNSSKKVLISVPPINNKDAVLKIFNNTFLENSFDWITYLSATSVYGDKQGQWVDELTTAKPSSERGISRLNAENDWFYFYKKYNLPIQIFRLSGIYSIENNVIKRLKAGNIKMVKKKNHFFSRIHVEDIAEILSISLEKFAPGQIYNISDNYPCSNEEITKYAANLIKINSPEFINLNDIQSNMLKEFYKDSKKVSNKKMKNFFKYNLKYPTYKEGLEMIRKKII